MKGPKPRIRKVFERVVENGGNVSRAMLEEKYSPNTAKTPQKVTESKSWEMLLEEYLPDDLITKKTREGFEAKTPLGTPDYSVRQRYIETALKMKGKITEKKDITSGGKPIPLLGNVPDNLGS